jgi:hypothetical protein
MEQQRICRSCEGQTNTLADFVSLDLVRNFPFNSAGLSRKRPRYQLWGFGGVKEFEETPWNPDAQLR